jgi:glycosyltransferase involved in cell wall biosynthesis
MIEPLVSVIVPLYNAEKYIGQCIASVLAQTWPNIEVIIVDDGSTDGSYETAQKYEGNHVMILRQTNSGASIARNKGLSVAKGSFVQFLDADDILSTNKIAAQMELLKNSPDKVAVCSTVHFFDHENYQQLQPSPYEDGFLINDDSPVNFLLNLWGANNTHGSMIQPNAWLTPRHIIEKAGMWNEFKCPDDDGEFFCRVLLAGKGVVCAKGCFNYYRKFKSTGSLSSSKSHESFENILTSAKLKYEYMKKATDKPEVDRVFAKNFLEIGILTFPQFPNLSKEAIALAQSLDENAPRPVIGGAKTEFIKKYFGWKIARYLQYYLQKN